MSEPGYLYPVLAVGRRLRQRGWSVTVLGAAHAADAVAAAELDFIPARSPEGDGVTGFTVSRWFLDPLAQYLNVLDAARTMSADAVLTSVLSHGSLLAAEALDVPAVVVGLAAHLWTYRGGAENEAQSPARRAWRASETIKHYQLARDLVGLPARHDAHPETPLYGAGLLLRGDPVLEYPGAELPAAVHHVGPCRWEAPADPGEVSQLIDGARRASKPLVYVHLGRVFGGVSMWPRLNASFTDSGLQAIVELGRSGKAELAEGADIVAVRKPWMAPLIRSADLVLTNGTTAATLAALDCGRPLVMAPAGSEQPLLTDACLRARLAGDYPSTLSGTEPTKLWAALNDQDLAARVLGFSQRLAQIDGAGQAAEFVISVMRSDRRITALAG